MRSLFLHIGGDAIVSLNDVVAILDMRALANGTSTAEFLGLKKAQGQVEDLSNGHPKACIICRKRVFLSSVSVGTLQRRTGHLEDFLEHL